MNLTLINIKNILLGDLVTYQYVLVISLANLLSHRSFKSYINNDAVYSFINSMIEESKYCSDTVIKYFNKELAMTKNIDEDFEDSTKYWIYDNAYAVGNNKVRDIAISMKNVEV